MEGNACFSLKQRKLDHDFYRGNLQGVQFPWKSTQFLDLEVCRLVKLLEPILSRSPHSYVILFVSLFPVFAQRSQWWFSLLTKLYFSALVLRFWSLIVKYLVSHGWYFSSFSKPFYWIVYENYMEKSFLGHLCELKVKNWHVSLWKVGLPWENMTPFPSTSQYFFREICKATTIRFYFFL